MSGSDNATDLMLGGIGEDDHSQDRNDSPPDDNSDLSDSNDSSNSSPVSLRAFVMDNSNVSPDKRMSYIMMMGIVTMDVSPLTIHPFSEIFGKKRGRWKSKLYPTKDMLVQETKRVRPDLKVNKSNLKIKELFALIPRPHDPKDIEFVKKMIKQYRETLLRGLEDEAPDVGRITATDPL